jgi:hypothetical protein
MNNTFAERVGAAAIAGWWTLLIGVIFLIIQWLLYLILIPARPSWIQHMWGTNLSWDFVQTVWFWGTAVFKLCLWIMAFIALWLTLWARQLRKARGAS